MVARASFAMLPSAAIDRNSSSLPMSSPKLCPGIPDVESHFFEGTEKRIEIDFVTSDGRGLRDAQRSDWDEVVKLSGTQVLKHKSTDAFESFVLSESSLIVYPFKVILKTCGRTVPIEAIPYILKLARRLGTRVEWLAYSRKNFLQPMSQPAQHSSFDKEIKRCQALCGLGHAYILGPVTGDHWLLYSADFIPVDGRTRYDVTLDLMMYELPSDVRLNFYETHAGNADGMTKASGLGALATSLGGVVEAESFEPCGYSCNAHLGDAYFMVHVTPEESCSYASFETNLGGESLSGVSGYHQPPKAHGVNGVDLKQVLRQVLDMFRPGKFTLTMTADEGWSGNDRMRAFDEVAAMGCYKQKASTQYQLENDYMVAVGNYVYRTEPHSKRPRAA